MLPRFLLHILAALACVGCAEMAPPAACVPGLVQACPCANGVSATQTCNGLGSGFGQCGPCMTSDVPTPPPIDVPNGVMNDVPNTIDARADTFVPGGPSRAGAACVDDSMCGALTCDTSVGGGICTGMCQNGSPASEQNQCGGTGSTCITAGDGATANSLGAALAC